MKLTSKYQPIGYRVLIRPEEVEEVTKGGIVLAKKVVEEEKLAQVRGKVVALGSDAFDDSKDSVEVGDIVLYQRYSGMRIVNEDGSFKDDLILLNDRDITCVVKSIPDEESN